MSVQLGNLLGAVTQASTAIRKPMGIKGFLASVNKLGIQVTNNFEVNFSGIPDITFYFQSINIPGMELKTSEIIYDGKKIEIPVNFDYQHEFNVTVINDAQGYIYPTLTNFIITTTTSDLIDSGYTMTIKAMTGDNNYGGTMYTLFGVRLVNIGNLDYTHDGGNVSTFQLQFKCTYFTATPGALGTASNILGAVNNLIG